MIQITVSETDYFLPEDGQAALAEFLSLLQGGYTELWICAYGFTLQPVFYDIKAADVKGVKCHLLLDHSQALGQAEASKVKDLAASLKNGDVTITTAGVNSGKPSEIWHWKGFVAKYLTPNASNYKCWEGSTNFSQSAWDQGNSARIFESDQWAQVFIAQQQAHILWARTNEPQYQI